MTIRNPNLSISSGQTGNSLFLFTLVFQISRKTLEGFPHSYWLGVNTLNCHLLVVPFSCDVEFLLVSFKLIITSQIDYPFLHPKTMASRGFNSRPLLSGLAADLDRAETGTVGIANKVIEDQPVRDLLVRDTDGRVSLNLCRGSDGHQRGDPPFYWRFCLCRWVIMKTLN